MRRWFLVFPALYLFALPFGHVTALRSIGFAGTLCLLAWILVRERPRLPLKAPLGFWLAAASVSLFWSIDLRYSIDELRGDVVYGIATFYAFFVLTRNEEDLRLWRRITATSLGLMGLAAVVSYLKHGEWVDGFHNFIGEYATFVVTALPLLLTAFLAGPLRAARKERALTAAAIALGLCGALVAKSRAFWLIIMTSGVVVAGLLLARNRASRSKAILHLALLASVAAAALAYGTSQRGTPLAFFADRAPIYEFSIGEILQRPLAGTGYGRETNRAAYRTQFPGRGFFHPHSLPFSYAEQMGVLGLVAILWLFGALFRFFWRVWRSDQPDIVAAGLVGLVLLTAVALKNIPDMFFVGHLLLLFCAHAGMLVGYVQARSRPPSASDAR